MSLSIIKEPYEITLVRNPINYQLQTNNLFVEADVFPKITLLFVAMGTDGDGFSFYITDPDSGQPVYFVFNASPSPDDEGWTYSDLISWPGTLEEYVEHVYTQMLKNIQLASFFAVSYDGDKTITLTALFASADLIARELQQIQRDFLGVPWPHVTTSSSSIFLSKSRRANFRVLFDVYFEDEIYSNEWRKVATLKDEPDSNGIAAFDLSSILSAELKQSFENAPVPSLTEFDATEANNNRRYYVTWCEYYDGQTTDLFWYIDKPKLAHVGGVSHEDWSKQNPFSYLFGKKQFLTWQPNFKNLTDVQNDWISWINYQNAENVFTARIIVYFTDGTNSGPLTITSLLLKPWAEMLIPVGYIQRDIETIAGVKDAHKWEIFVIQGTTTVSEVRTYYRLDGPYLHNNELLYLNAFGAPESFTTTGIWEEKTTIDKQFVERALGINYTLINGQEFQFDQQSKTNYVANTGYMSKDFILALRDILVQTDVFLLEDNEYIPIIIAPGNFAITSSLEFLNQLKLSIRRSFKIGNYSKEVRIPVFLPTLNCGLVGFTINSNYSSIVTFGNMRVSYEGTLIYTSIPYTADAYTYPDIQTREGVYRIEADLILADGSTIEFDFNYNLRHQKAFIDLPLIGTANIYTYCFTGLEDKWYVNWGVGDLETNHTIGDTYESVTETMIHYGVKRMRISTLCPQNIKRINLYSNTAAFDLTAFYNLEYFQLLYAETAGTVDISSFKMMHTCAIIGNNITQINVGFHENMSVFAFSENLLDEFAIESILLQIWRYRQYYINTGIDLNFVGNPGALVMTATALDIINGTGDYIDEGLASDYSFSISY